MTEQMIDEMLNDIKFKEVKKLLTDLAIHFTKDTKIMPVPPGTRTYRIVDVKGTGLFDTATISIPLISFFGMYVGYNSKLDILVCW